MSLPDNWCPVNLDAQGNQLENDHDRYNSFDRHNDISCIYEKDMFFEKSC